MNEYGWDDLIINPYGKKVESYIGKEVYYADNPTACLNYANSNDDKTAGILDSIQPGILTHSTLAQEETTIIAVLYLKKKNQSLSMFLLTL